MTRRSVIQVHSLIKAGSLFFGVIMISQVLGVVVSLGERIQPRQAQASSDMVFASSFPHYTDANTGNIVYQITSDPGLNYLLYYHQNYSNDPDSVYVVNLPPGAWATINYKINLRTGAKTVVTNQEANGEFVRGNNWYAFNYAATPNYFGKLDLVTKQWQTLFTMPAGWVGTGAITVNINETEAIIQAVEWGHAEHIATYIVHIPSKTYELLREEPASDKDHYEHFQFSPTNPDLFTYINQRSTFGLPRVGIGTVSSKQLRQINLEAVPGSYFDPAVFAGNMAHPVWNANGQLCTDILWHPQNPVETYGFACFTIGGNPFVPVPQENQVLRFIPLNAWNTHLKEAISADWFVGDGNISVGLGQTLNTYVSLLHMTHTPDAAHRYSTDVYHLAEIKGPFSPYTQAQVVANGQGVVTSWSYNLAGSADQNVFLIQIPQNLVSMISPGLNPVAPPPVPINYPPGGVLEYTTNTTAVGWANDPNTSNEIQIQFYIDDTRSVGTASTSILRQDVNNSLKVTGNHGFSFPIPFQDLVPGSVHTIRAFALNVPEGPNTELAGSPKTFVVPSAPPPPAPNPPAPVPPPVVLPPPPVNPPPPTPTVPPGTTFKYTNKPAVYYLNNQGCKEIYTSMTIVNAWNVASHIQTLNLSANSFPDCGFVKLGERTLVKGSTPTVYVIEGGVLRAFVSLSAAQAKGFTIVNVNSALKLQDWEVALYTKGEIYR